MKEDFLNQLRDIKEQDLSKLPKYITMLAIRDSLIRKEIESKEANLLVGSIKINVNQNFINDAEFMEQSIDLFSDILVKVYCQMTQDCLFDSIQSIASELSFEATL